MRPGPRIFGMFLGMTLVIATVLLVSGYAPTRRLAGDEALAAMFAGCAVGVAASLGGTVPVFLARNKPHLEAWTAAMAAMAVRLGIALVLAVALALSGIFPVKPLLLWVAISHAGFLVPDTLLSVKVLAQQGWARPTSRVQASAPASLASQVLGRDESIRDRAARDALGQEDLA